MLGSVAHAGRRRLKLARRWALRARLDLQDRRSGERDPLLPPRRKNLPSQIAAVGERLVEIMVDPGGLKPDSAVLDIGCGPGRVAAVLARRLEPGASYEGFDVMPGSIRWCRKAITRRYPNFRFQLADLENLQYNPDGRQAASEYTFPYPDDTFDVAVAGSLFTHLRPFESQRYLHETARVLKPGARLVGTWFLINDEVESLLEAGQARRPGIFGASKPPMRLDHAYTDPEGNRFRSPEPEVPEYLIAVFEEDVRAQHERAGLRIVETAYGRWPGRETDSNLLGQDVIIAERVAG